MQVFKCDKLCTISDREVKCERCGKLTKYLCDVETVEERDILANNLQKSRIKKIIKKK